MVSLTIKSVTTEVSSLQHLRFIVKHISISYLEIDIKIISIIVRNSNLIELSTVFKNDYIFP